MNKLKLKEYNEHRLIYLYQPEGKGGYGEIVYNFEDKTASILKVAEECSTYYSNKALSKVEECAIGKSLPIDFIQAWV